MVAESTEQKKYWARYDAPLLEDYTGDTEDGPDMQHVFGPVNRINIFTGPNNSGKSRAMRGLFEGRIRVNQFSSANFRRELDSFFENLKVIEPWLEGLHLRLQKQSPRTSYFLENCGEAYSALEARDVSATSIQVQGEQICGFWRGINSKHLDAIRKIDSGRQNLSSRRISSPSLYLVYSKECMPNIKGALNSLLLTRYAFDLEADPHDRILNFKDHKVTEPKARAEIPYLDSLIAGLKKMQSSNPESDFPMASASYIPTLRSLHSLTGMDGKRIDDDFYNKSIERNYFTNKKGLTIEIGDGKPHKIFTGQDLYWQVLQAKNGTDTSWKKLQAFEEFISNQFFQGRPFRMVAKVDRDQIKGKMSDAKGEHHLMVAIGDEQAKEIHQLGDGIQSIIMLTYPIFMAEKGEVVFIEEPELHLHPGLQRVFMEALNEKVIKDKNLTFFLTTHSNHLVDLLLTEDKGDISIFTFQEAEGNKKLIRNVKAGNKDILSMLGVTSSSVFLANCSIWVEGPTDRLYIRKFLDEYLKSGKDFREDNPEGKVPKEHLDYVFFEYGGTLLHDYGFGNLQNDEAIKAARISNRILVIADKDNTEEKTDSWKARRYKALESLNGEYFVFCPHKHAREIENYLDHSTIYGAACETHPQNFKMLDPGKILHEEYVDRNLWGYLGDLVGQKPAPEVKKMDFCRNAVKRISWGSMTEEAKQLAREVYAFILEKGK